MKIESEIPFFSYEELLILARKSVENKGEDYVYGKALAGDTCVYVDGGAPSCLVGDMLWTANVIGPEFEENYNNTEGVMALLGGGVFSTDETGEVFVHFLQRLQDAQVPWGEAVELSSSNVAEVLKEPDLDKRVYKVANAILAERRRRRENRLVET